MVLLSVAELVDILMDKPITSDDAFRLSKT